MARIGVVFGRPTLDGPRLLYMPFALSTIKLLIREGHEIDLYLCERRNRDYDGVFNANVKVYFLDNTLVWRWGKGRGLFLMLNLFFLWRSLFKKYSNVWGIGIVGSSLAGRLASLKGMDYYYMSDEFPDIYFLRKWVDSEKRYALKARTWIVPDESRIDITMNQIPGLERRKSIVLPNCPLVDNTRSDVKMDWHARLNIPRESQIVLYAGGIDKENNIELLLTVFPFSSDEFYFVMIGRNRGYADNPIFKHPRIIWIDTPLSDEDLDSLHQSSLCIIAFYSSMMWLEYVGKSSGKIMRSLMAGCPVIATNFDSLSFIRENGFGVLIGQPHELISALNEIKSNRAIYLQNIIEKRKLFSFERYWDSAKLLK
jgi:glycosyltransferase involved in cell wall biosynthesis